MGLYAMYSSTLDYRCFFFVVVDRRPPRCVVWSLLAYVRWEGVGMEGVGRGEIEGGAGARLWVAGPVGPPWFARDNRNCAARGLRCE